jgi:hypothetical protein
MLKAQNLKVYCNFENNIITKHTILQIEQLMFNKYALDWQYKQVLSWTAFLSYQPVSTLRGATPHLSFAYALLYFSQDLGDDIN